MPVPGRADRETARRAIVELLAARAPDATICPSEAARALAGDDFRPLMPLVRDAARTLVEDGAIDATQGGEPVDLTTARGPIRLRAAAGPAARPADPAADPDRR